MFSLAKELLESTATAPESELSATSLWGREPSGKSVCTGGDAVTVTAAKVFSNGSLSLFAS